MIGVVLAAVFAAQPCEAGPVRLETGFPGSMETVCVRREDGAFVLSVRPEAAPINPSPWYALALDGDAREAVRVELDYGAWTHRYAPWMRAGGGAWRRVPDEYIERREDGGAVQLTVPLHAGRLEIAAQPLVTASYYAAYEAALPGGWRTIGRSVEGRSIRARISPPATPGAGWIVLLGRQHPPETPGVYAFEGFAEVINAAYEDGRLDTGVILIPLLNPDGVEGGHWRLNAGGVDLNRDWAALSQPETQAVAALMDTLGVDAGDIALMVDFHATHGDRLYLPHDAELPPDRAAELNAWLDAMEADGLFERTEPRRTNPARRVSAKSVFTDRWAAIALSWEAADTTSAEDAAETARRGAQAWLNRHPPD